MFAGPRLVMDGAAAARRSRLNEFTAMQTMMRVERQGWRVAGRR